MVIACRHPMSFVAISIIVLLSAQVEMF
jgi:hypothetical protein